MFSIQLASKQSSWPCQSIQKEHAQGKSWTSNPHISRQKRLPRFCNVCFKIELYLSENCLLDIKTQNTTTFAYPPNEYIHGSDSCNYLHTVLHTGTQNPRPNGRQKNSPDRTCLYHKGFQTLSEVSACFQSMKNTIGFSNYFKAGGHNTT